MSDQLFFIHEHDWGELELLPVENRRRWLALTRQNQASGASRTWRNTQEDCSLLAREIPLHVLEGLLAPRLPRSGIVQTGSSASLRVVEDGFAFGEGYGEGGALYGTQVRGTIHSLHVQMPQTEDEQYLVFFAQVLGRLARTYDLFLLDQWHRRVVSLRDEVTARTYVYRCAEELGARDHGPD